MATSVSVYNHTTRLLALGSFNPALTLKAVFCTAATFDAGDTTLAGIVKTESSGGGYPAGGLVIAGTSATTVGAGDCMFDATDTSIVPAGTALSASYVIVYEDNGVEDPPLILIDFGQSVTAEVGVPFVIEWNVLGIFRFLKPQ